MTKILVGRDNPKEVNIGVTVSQAAQPETVNAEAKEEPAQAPVKDEQVEPAEEGDAPEEKAQAAVKGRGKKRTKA